MNNLKDFVIQFRGLGVGSHELEFKVNDSFFEAFNYSDLKAGDENVNLSMEKQETMLVLDFLLKGSVKVLCDRCLDEFDYKLHKSEQLIVQFGKSYKELSDEIVVIPENAYEIDIAPYIYEYINLSLPIQKMHPNDSEGNSRCRKEITNLLNELSGEKQMDPRWEELKKLKDKTD